MNYNTMSRKPAQKRLMTKKDKGIMCKLIRDHEDIIGASRLTMLCIRSFIDSIKALQLENVDEMLSLFRGLSAELKDTEPKVVPLIHILDEFEEDLKEVYSDNTDDLKRQAIRLLKRKYSSLKSRAGKTIEKGLRHIQDNDVIIVHTASLDLINMMVMAKEIFQRTFKVIILKQDFTKTKRLINPLQKSALDMTIIPEYSLSHYIEHANKLFIGALSVTHDMQVVAPIGTANVASLCHVNELPVYLITNTLKFSHRPSVDQQIHRKVVTKDHDNCSYTLTTYSHDMMDLKLVDYLITEDGTVEADEIEGYIYARVLMRFLDGKAPGTEENIPGPPTPKGAFEGLSNEQLRA